MNLVFVHKGKHCNYYYKFDSPEDQEYAWLDHFRLNDCEGYYDYAEGRELEFVELARTGNWKAAKRVAENRGGYENEGFDIEQLYGHEDGELA